jgi:hypothetical protein
VDEKRESLLGENLERKVKMRLEAEHSYTTGSASPETSSIYREHKSIHID